MRRPATLLVALIPLPVAIFAQAPAPLPESSSTAAAPIGSAVEAGPSAIHKVGSSVLPPKLTYQVEPKYPRPLFGRPKESRVLVGLVITTAGLPSQLHVVHSGGAAFDKSALQCVAQYRFSPATENGSPSQSKCRST